MEEREQKNEPNIIKGRILGPDGSPILAIDVKLYNSKVPGLNIQTNEFGEFSFPQLQNGTYYLSISDRYKRGLLSRQDTVKLKGKWEPLRTITLPYSDEKAHMSSHTNEIYGNVTDDISGSPIKEVSLTVSGPVAFRLAVDPITGSFSQKHLPSGQYIITAHSSTHRFADVPITLNDSATAAQMITGTRIININVRLPRNKIFIKGRVFGLKGKNTKRQELSNIQVMFEGPQNTHLVKRTDKNGAFSSPDLLDEVRKARAAIQEENKDKQDEEKQDEAITYKVVFRDLKKRYTYAPVTVVIKGEKSPASLIVYPRSSNNNSISGFVIGKGDKTKGISGTPLPGITVTIHASVSGFGVAMSTQVDTYTTNKLGFFTTAQDAYFTGNYTIVCKDPNNQYEFQPAQVKLSGLPAHVVIIGIKKQTDENTEKDKEDKEKDEQEKQSKQVSEDEKKKIAEEIAAMTEGADAVIPPGEWLTEFGPFESVANPPELSETTESGTGFFTPRRTPQETGAGFFAPGTGSAEPMGAVNPTPFIPKSMPSPLGNISGISHGAGAAEEGLGAASHAASGVTGGFSNALNGLSGMMSNLGGALPGDVGNIVNTVQKVSAIASNAQVWVPILIIGIIIFFFFLHSSGGFSGLPNTSSSSQQSGGGSTGNSNAPIPNLTIHKDGPASVNNGDDITYTITVNNPGNSAVTVLDSIDATLGKITKTDPPATTSTDSSASWDLQKIGKGPSYTLSLVVHPLKDNITIENRAIATAVGSATSGTGGDISACKFYRGYGDAGEVYKSPLLLSYFSDAEKASGVPASLLAAFARVESNAPEFTDASLQADPCPGSSPGTIENSAGAVGLMQMIDSSNPNAHFAQGIALGASFAGLNYSSLTSKDYCDPKTSIFFAAGFLIAKMQYSFPSCPSAPLGDGKTWNPKWTTDQNAIEKMACIYYGALSYSGGNYGDDLWNSVSQCKVATSGSSSNSNLGNNPTHPTPPQASSDPTQLASQIQSQFGITMKGFDEEHLQLAWNKFWDISNTRFFTYHMKGTTVNATSASSGYAWTYPPCDVHSDGTVSIRVDMPEWDPGAFEYGLIHELGHVIDFCDNASVSYKDDMINANTAEGPISAYVAKYTNPGTQDNEDYADSISLYLNPIVPGVINPYSGGQHPQHLKVVQEIVGQY